MSSIEQFGKYILLEKLAAGGMAEVYLAKSVGASGVNKFLAIKRILPQYSDNPEFIDMFKEEAKIAVNLNHSNVVSIFDFGIEKNQFYLVMEYVEGRNLRQIINELKKTNQTFTTQQAIYIAKEVAGGLDHAHRCIDGATGKPLNITHRDMSPQNVMISFEGEVKIVDFGIAKAETQLEATKAGTLKGKFGYMSPEQADGQVVDLRTDIFSLGIVLWELLTNDRLFTGTSEAAILRKIRNCEIPPISKTNPNISPELEKIVEKALSKDKNTRYQTASAFHRDLNKFLNTEFPDFSPHDFSLFMKNAFAQVYLEQKKRLVEYAKIQTQNSSADKTLITSEDPYSNMDKTELDSANPTQIDSDEMLDLDIQDGATQNVHLEISNTGTGKANNTKNKHKVTKRKNKKYVSGSGGGSGTGTHSNSNYTSKGDQTFLMFAIAIVFIVLGYFGYQELIANKSSDPFKDFNTSGNFVNSVAQSSNANSTQNSPSNTPKIEEKSQVTTAKSRAQPPSITSKQAAETKREEQSTEIAATAKPYTLAIKSNPPGAKIYINTEDTGYVTPYTLDVEPNKMMLIAIRKSGFNTYEKEYSPNQEVSTINANLIPLNNAGYISLNIINGGLNPIIKINNITIEEKPPIEKYAVPADVPVKIRVENPFTQMAAEKIIKVSPNQKEMVELVLEFQKRKPSGK